MANSAKLDRKWWCPIIEDWVADRHHHDKRRGIVGAIECNHGVQTYANGVPVTGIDFRTSEEGRLKLYEGHVKSLEPLASVPAGYREEILFDFTHCKHELTQIFEIVTDLGTWGVEVCMRCAVQVTKECAHDKCAWVLDGKLLVCPNCGVDGT